MRRAENWTGNDVSFSHSIIPKYFFCNHWNQSKLANSMWCSIFMPQKTGKQWGQLKTPHILLTKKLYAGIGKHYWLCLGSRTVDLPEHGRSTDIQQHQSSSHTRTGIWHICKACPGTPDGTAKNEYIPLLSKSSFSLYGKDLLKCNANTVTFKHY